MCLWLKSLAAQGRTEPGQRRHRPRLSHPDRERCSRPPAELWTWGRRSASLALPFGASRAPRTWLRHPDAALLGFANRRLRRLEEVYLDGGRLFRRTQKTGRPSPPL